MPSGELKIRTAQTSGWKDAYDTWGVSFDDAGLSRLMTPAPNKKPVENKSELEHGKRIIRDTSNVMKDERTISIVMNLSASNKSAFFTRYANFCEQVLDAGYIEIATCYQRQQDTCTVYKMTYEDCTQFSEFERELGKFTLTLNEPNPKDRSLGSGDIYPSFT